MEIMNIVGSVSDIAGFAGVFFALFAWLQARRTAKDLSRERDRLAKKIHIVLVFAHEGNERVLPVALRRGELTRAELLGRLGMMPMAEAGKRFSLRFLSTPEFLAKLEAAQEADGEFRFEIPCADAQEFNQFA